MLNDVTSSVILSTVTHVLKVNLLSSVKILALYDTCQLDSTVPGREQRAP